MKEYLDRHGRKSNHRSLLTKMLKGDEAAGTSPLLDDEISVEVSNAVFAATDTTGNTMAYALYRLCCHPELQNRLREEVRTTLALGQNLAYQNLQTLPVLHGVVMETMRLHPAAPSGLPRMTTGQGCKVAGMQIPAKVVCVFAPPAM
jgi:cytochrome P450